MALACPARLALAILVAAVVPAVAEDSDHEDHAHHFVRITEGKLTPRVTTMRPGEAVAWANYSPKTAVIAFDREVGKRIVCDAPGSFRLTEQRLESAALRPRQFASLCQLTPGRYAYVVELRDAARGTPPSEGLEGTIVVEPAQGSP